mgnify:CR=1 FL=1
MAEILKMFEFSKKHRVAKVQVGRGRVKPAFTLSGLPEAKDFSSFDLSSPRG